MPISHYTTYRRQPVAVLPDPESLPFPGGLIRTCKDCGLSSTCTAPVPGENIDPSVDIVFAGQNPGRNEDQQGRPFIGQAGQYLDSLLFQIRVPRDQVAVTNIVHCMTPNNRVPSPVEIVACSKWIDLELEVIQPRIIVAMGYPAIVHFLGSNAGTVEQLHGKPIELDGRIILPTYHPAAALHDTSKLRQCQEDFQVLCGLVDGNSWRSFHVIDEYPSPDYRVADTEKAVADIAVAVDTAGEFAVDTEQGHGNLWSIQISTRPGSAWFIPVKDNFKGRANLTKWGATAIVHYYLHDIQWLDIKDNKFVDTMVMAYLLGLPQGLKELATRLCGIQMQSYAEIVRPKQQELSLKYLREAEKRDWPDPPPIEETKWNNKKGELITRAKKPWAISRKIKGMLGSDSDIDFWERWHSIPDEERSVVESVLGPMPQSSLMDIPFDQAVEYSCRDSDSTLRVYHKLKKLIAKLNLDFVLDMDLRILPMVDSMMRNGMAVDLDHYRKLSADYDIRMRVKAAQLAAMVGHSFNPASSLQVASVIYEELGFKPTRATATGLISTDDAELKKTGHPVAEEIIRYRGLQKLKSTYADNMICSAYPDEQGVPRIHTQIKTTRVATGRLSSSKNEDGTGINLQNIPTRNKESRAIKNGFIAPNGKVLIEGDLGQVELRTQAHLARCKGLIELFNRDGDPHAETASKIFGVPLEEAAKDKYRYPCKRAGFGIIYMIGPKGLSTQINEYIADLAMEGESTEIEPWDEDACTKFIEEYYSLYPEIRTYQHRQLVHARRYGYVQDLFGRIRYIPEVTCPIRHIQEAGARMAANFAVTSSAQGIIKTAMGRLWEELPDTDWADALVLMQIHDSLVFEIPDNDIYMRGLLSWVEGVMTGVVKLLVPIKVDFKVGKAWGELRKEEVSK